MWNATSVTCDGGALSLGNFAWQATIDGGSGAFVSTITTTASCSLTEAGPIACVGNVLTTHRDQPYTCNPAACSPYTALCGAPPDGGSASWSVSMITATTFVLTSLDQPDGGPTPIRTCTGSGKQNPVQVTWTKM